MGCTVVNNILCFTIFVWAILDNALGQATTCCSSGPQFNVQEAIRELQAFISQQNTRFEEMGEKYSTKIEEMNNKYNTRFEEMDAKYNSEIKLLKEQVQNQEKTNEASNVDLVAFFVIRTSHMNPVTTWTPITYQKVVTNKRNGFDVTSSKFTAPIAGVYQFSWDTLSHRRTGIGSLKGSGSRLVHNGKEIVRAFSASAIHEMSGNTVILELVTNDQVWIELRPQDTSWSPTLYGYTFDPYVTFSGHILSKA